jgi:hypothetical protein
MTTDPGGSPAVQSVIAYDILLQQTKVSFDYDQYGDVVTQTRVWLSDKRPVASEKADALQLR